MGYCSFCMLSLRSVPGKSPGDTACLLFLCVSRHRPLGGRLIRKVRQRKAHAIDPVLVNLDNLVGDAVGVGNRFSAYGDMFKKHVEVAGDGVVVIRLEGEAGGIVDIVKLGGAVQKELRVGYLRNKNA